ncbi:MAG TPA: gephyrin-like molybdotransferase Glp [Dehalococcoidales bacterium]|nr:gephyrin-like molybdotransferase Glp [Dehalococcoidales bacterium]
MAEFLKLVTPDEALQKLKPYLQTLVLKETVATADALARVTAADIMSPGNLPSFHRSTMDGYAVIAADTYGATEGLPAYLKLTGEMPMGRDSGITVKSGEAVKVYTGGMLPGGADAVVMVENTQQPNDTTIEVFRPVAPGENVLRVGDDIKKGAVVLPAGSVIRAQDIGGLMALGLTKIEVYSRPRVAIISAGDEVVAPEKTPLPGQIRDINTYTISNLVKQSGGIPVPCGIMPDEFEKISRTAQHALIEAEVLVISSGSSISTRDLTVKVIASLGEPGVLVHGISLRPGKPTIVAAAGNKPVFGLPGNPVSAMVVFNLLARPAIYRVGGCTNPPPIPTVNAALTHNIASTTGREDYVPVKLVKENGHYQATPIFGESNLITTMMRADGVAKIPLDKHGLNAGETVDVMLF